ncbi:MAG: SDR family oxidoreductase [Proteobacteria bacterium]|nr:SDR family oxidoreductase [Pseudomonadota bacterium]
MRQIWRLHRSLNNAGVLWKDRDKSVIDTEEEWWDRVMGINLKGVYFACKFGIPHLIAAGGGSIINIGSVSALRGFTMPRVRRPGNRTSGCPDPT